MQYLGMVSAAVYHWESSLATPLSDKIKAIRLLLLGMLVVLMAMGFVWGLRESIMDKVPLAEGDGGTHEL
jgi:hypothetical protein